LGRRLTPRRTREGRSGMRVREGGREGGRRKNVRICVCEGLCSCVYVKAKAELRGPTKFKSNDNKGRKTKDVPWKTSKDIERRRTGRKKVKEKRPVMLTYS